MTFLRLTAWVLLVLCTLWNPVQSFDLPNAKAVPMKLVGRMDFQPIQESSGIVRSKVWPEWLWTHNDSGDSARIFAVQKNGAIVRPSSFPADYQGLAIKDAVNIDWEDIATDESGNLHIAACGNNANSRRDLAIYKLAEPNATRVIAARSFQRYDFVYSDQPGFPPGEEQLRLRSDLFRPWETLPADQTPGRYADQTLSL